MYAFITNKIDYCNSIIYGMFDNMINHLQKLQNIIARILTRNSKQYDTYFKIVILATCKISYSF